jgi:hypothetical protein
MPGVIARLLGGTRDPGRPGAGEGGYTYPRGPMGQTGYPGSTPQAPQTKSQEPGDGDRKLGPPRRNRHGVNRTPNPNPDIIDPDSGGGQGLQQDVSANQAAWASQPPRMPSGEPLQPPAMITGTGTEADRDYTVTRHIAGSAPVLGRGVPGNQNQRNTRYYGGRQAAAGLQSSAAFNGAGPGLPAPVQPHVSPVPEAGENRTVLWGGGVQSWEVERQMPLRVHARPAAYHGAPSNRGADLSGERYFLSGQPEIQLNAQQGRYGQRKKEGPLHRPTTFSQPAPWSANFYDTSAAEQQGTSKQAADMVYVSPAPARSSVTGKRRRA